MADLAGLRRAARQILDAAIAAGDAGRLTRQALIREGSRLRVGDRIFDLGRIRRVVVVGAGKASGPMAEAAEAVLDDVALEGLVAVKERRDPAPRRIRIVESGHPIPDARGEAAAGEILRLVQEAGSADLVLCLISGGGSALTPSPVLGVTLGEKQAVTRLLLECGATINELNAVRKHLSRLKGGQLARTAHPAPVVSLLLSDVIGDPLDVIASGPTAPDPTTYGDALSVLDRFGLRARVSPTVRAHLEAGARGEVADTPKPGAPALAGVTNVVIGNNGLVVEAAVAEARRLGLAPCLLTRSLQGEAREVARAFAAILDEIARSGSPVGRPACLIAGGETTVTVRGRGTGGRCQEFALALAPELAAMRDVAVLAAGTDGSDGPTDAAGAIADPTTIARAGGAGLDARRALAENDSHAFFAALGDLVVTGPTGSNLMDVYLGVVG
ncbi:MAG TPA: glycerate kinase [Methylomirabilota bacterium]